MTWLTVTQAAEHAKRSKSWVSKSAACGELHSHQRCPGGKRALTVAAVDAWVQGLSEKQQIQACGCERVLRAVS